MSPERRAQAALATMLIVTFGRAPLVVISERVIDYGPGVALAVLAALPLLAVGLAIEILVSSHYANSEGSLEAAEGDQLEINTQPSQDCVSLSRTLLRVGPALRPGHWSAISDSRLAIS